MRDSAGRFLSVAFAARPARFAFVASLEARGDGGRIEFWLDGRRRLGVLPVRDTAGAAREQATPVDSRGVSGPHNLVCGSPACARGRASRRLSCAEAAGPSTAGRGRARPCRPRSPSPARPARAHAATKAPAWLRRAAGRVAEATGPAPISALPRRAREGDLDLGELDRRRPGLFPRGEALVEQLARGAGVPRASAQRPRAATVTFASPSARRCCETTRHPAGVSLRLVGPPISARTAARFSTRFIVVGWRQPSSRTDSRPPAGSARAPRRSDRAAAGTCTRPTRSARCRCRRGACAAP